VRICLEQGIAAIGLSGQDGGLIRAKAARSASGESLGYVGEITRVDPAPLLVLLTAGYLPVVAPIAVDELARHAYNVNADTAAGALAAAIQADAYVVLTNVDRVLRSPMDPSTAVERFAVTEALDFARSHACAGGMRPKLLAAVHAVRGGARRAYICAAKPGAISHALSGNATVIEAL
jgi:acetylglutamate kinase